LNAVNGFTMRRARLPVENYFIRELKKITDVILFRDGFNYNTSRGYVKFRYNLEDNYVTCKEVFGDREYHFYVYHPADVLRKILIAHFPLTA